MPRNTFPDEFRIYRHKKTGGIYSWQCDAIMESDGTQMTVYSNLSTNQYYVRPSSEFYDGRFEEVTDENFEKVRMKCAIEKARNSAKQLGETIKKYEFLSHQFLRRLNTKGRSTNE